MSISVCSLHGVAVTRDGTVLSWGRGRHGELGLGDNVQKTAPTEMHDVHQSVRQVAAGLDHTALVTDEGDLYMCGSGVFGQLGLGRESNVSTPTPVPRTSFDGERVAMAACGDSHTAVVTEGGHVYTFGFGFMGALGHDVCRNRAVPTRVPDAACNGEKIVMAAAGGGNSLALSCKGNIFRWGSKGNGGILTPHQVETPERFAFVAVGTLHMAAITTDGHLYTWGSNSKGQLGQGDVGDQTRPARTSLGDKEVVMVACCHYHTMAVTRDGALWMCGQMRAGGGYCPDVRTEFGQVLPHLLGNVKVVSADAGTNCFYATTDDGALWAWGEGSLGRIAHPDTFEQRWPAKVPGTGPGGWQVGRLQPLPAEMALAFAMGSHARLGASSVMEAVAGEPGLSRLILDLCQGGHPVLGGGVLRQESFPEI